MKIIYDTDMYIIASKHKIKDGMLRVGEYTIIENAVYEELFQEVKTVENEIKELKEAGMLTKEAGAKLNPSGELSQADIDKMTEGIK